jgi:hypothetical protein
MDTSVFSVQEAARGDDLSLFKRGFSRRLHHLLKLRPCDAPRLAPTALLGSTGPGPRPVQGLFIPAQVHPPVTACHAGVKSLRAIRSLLQTPFV